MSAPTPSGERSRRQFLARAGVGVAAAVAAGSLVNGVLGSTLSAAEPSGRRRAAPSTLPIGLELYSVRRELARDLPGTLTAVAGMGYTVVEFYAPYLA